MATTTMSKTQLRTMGLRALATKAGKSVVKATRSTVAARKAELRHALAELDIDLLLSLQERMGRFVDLATIPLGEDLILSDSAKLTLMQQHLAKRDIAEFTDVIGDQIKALVIAHVEALHEAAGEEDPVNLNGTIEVPALGKKFCVEGAGFTDPTINETVLAALLPAEVSAEVFVTKEKVVVERTLDLQKLFAAVEADPKLMAAVEEALDPAKPKNKRVTVRDL